MAWRLIGPTCVYNGQLGYNQEGSGPVSGRVTALAFHPTHADELYVGTAGGGLWVTENAGQSWTPLMDDKQNFSIGALAIEPVAPFRLFIAPGEPNDGIFVFLGSGVHVYDTTAKTWEYHAGPGTSFLRVRSGALVAFQKGGDTKVLLGNSRGVFQWDAATGWTDVGAGLPVASPRIKSLAYNPVTETAYACPFGAGQGVYRRAAGGQWQLQSVAGNPQKMAVFSTLGRSMVALCQTKPERVYAALGSGEGEGALLALYASSDDGVTWQTRNIPTETRATYYNSVLAVHPALPDVIFYGATKLWRSIDGGNSWEVVSEPGGNDQGVHADQHAIVFHPTATVVGAARFGEVWLGNDGGVWRSDDLGVNWASRNRGLATMQYYSMAQHPKHASVMLVGAQDNGVQRYEGANCWNLVSLGDGFFSAIDHTQENIWFSSYIFQPNKNVAELQAIQRSEKAGARDSWRYTVEGINPNDTTDDDPFYVPFVMHPKQHDLLYLATSRLYRSTDSGRLWRPILLTNGVAFSTGTNYANRITTIELHPDQEVVYVGTADGRVFRLQRNPANNRWTSTPKNIAANSELISDIAIAVEATATGSKTHVYASLGSAHMPTSKPVAATPSRIFHHDESVAGDTFVARGGSQLDVEFDTGTPTPQKITHDLNPVNVIGIDPHFPARPYIGCNHGGVFRADNFGQSWERVAEGLPNSPVNDLAFHPLHRVLRAATLGRSIWELDVDAAGNPPPVDLLIRASVADSGVTPSVYAGPDPLNPGQTLDGAHSPDIIIDTPSSSSGGAYQIPASTDTYLTGGQADYISFHHFKHAAPRAGRDSRVYVRVHNRGMSSANADVRLFYAPRAAGGNFPDLQADFWDIAWSGTPAQFTAWKPVGDKASVPVGPAQAGVAVWTWQTPGELGGQQVGLLAITAASQEPFAPGTPLVVQELIENDRRVALHEVAVGAGDLGHVASVLSSLGLVNPTGTA